MTATTFTQLPRELRDTIWSAAAAVQYQQLTFILKSDITSVNSSIADGLPKSCTAPCAERLRQAFVGYDNLAHDTERQPLRVYVHESRGKLRLGVNEFQTLVNSLPMAAVCSEARSHAANFCRNQVKLVNLWYAIDEPDEEPSDVRAEIQEPVFMQPTTIMVTTGDIAEEHHVNFSSAEHLVGVVNRVFGNSVKQLILSFWFNSHNSFEEMYWPHTAQTQKLEHIEPIFINDPSHDQSLVFITPKRTAHVKEELYNGNYDNLKQLAYHLLKFHEILDASEQRLPRLQSIELELHTYSWAIKYLTRIQATNKDGVLWVNWNDVQIGMDHFFAYYDTVLGQKCLCTSSGHQTSRPPPPPPPSP